MAVTSDADIVDTDASQSVADLFDFTPNYGADGQGAAAVETYGIDLIGDVDLGDATVGIDSGFTSGDATVYLYQDGNTVVASTAGLKGDVDAGNIVFVVAVDPLTGALTLEQSLRAAAQCPAQRGTRGGVCAHAVQQQRARQTAAGNARQGQHGWGGGAGIKRAKVHLSRSLWGGT